jgi:hypothetical protein
MQAKNPTPTPGNRPNATTTTKTTAATTAQGQQHQRRQNNTNAKHRPLPNQQPKTQHATQAKPTRAHHHATTAPTAAHQPDNGKRELHQNAVPCPGAASYRDTHRATT